MELIHIEITRLRWYSLSLFYPAPSVNEMEIAKQLRLRPELCPTRFDSSLFPTQIVLIWDRVFSILNYCLSSYILQFQQEMIACLL